MMSVPMFVAISRQCLVAVMGGYAAFAQDSLDPRLRGVLSVPTDFPTTEDPMESRYERLRNQPELREPLLDLIRKAKDGKGDWERLPSAFHALAIVGNVPNDELKSIEEALEKLSVSSSKPDMLQQAYINGSIGLLSGYPNEKREELILRFLNSEERSFSFNAAMALGRMGSEKSVPAFRAYIERKKPAPGMVSDTFPFELAAFKELESRVAAKSGSEGKED